MISQKCPKCLSSRVRRGYRPTPFWSKILFRYNLLCDNCNWEFTGFAVPGTVSAKPTRNPKKKPVVKTAEDLSGNSNNSVQGSREKSAENLNQTVNPAAKEIVSGEKIVDEPASQSAGESAKKAQRESGV